MQVKFTLKLCSNVNIICVNHLPVSLTCHIFAAMTGISTIEEQDFENRLLQALCQKLQQLGEITDQEDFLENYPKDNLADIHNDDKGAYYLMTTLKPLKLIEYDLKTFEITVS